MSFIATKEASNERIPKTESTRQDLPGLPSPIPMAKEVGKAMGSNKILQPKMQEQQTSNGLIWFGNDLRTHDHEALFHASIKHESLLGLYLLRPDDYTEGIYGFPKTGKHRARFLQETLQELHLQLKAFGIPLIVTDAAPEDLLPEFVKTHNITDIYLQKEWTSEEAARTVKVKKLLEGKVRIHEFYQQFLIHPDDLPFAHLHEIPDLFTSFRKQVEANWTIRPEFPLPVVKKPLPCPSIQVAIPIPDLNSYETEPRSAFPFNGGETQGLNRLEYYCSESGGLSTYKSTRNQMIGRDYSSKLSAWLANGSVSPRRIYHRIRKYERKYGESQDTYWMIFELLWRDFFKYVSIKHGNRIFRLRGIQPQKKVPAGDHPGLFEQWIQGKTAEPFINANMNELRNTGWMSNRGRQNTASYWAKSCLQDWRKGAAYFESQLIDYDVHSNWVNWMYLSGVGNDLRDRKFNIGSQQQLYDPDSHYINLWTK